MNRRTLLSCLAGLPFLGWLRPSVGRPGHSVPLVGEDGWHHYGIVYDLADGTCFSVTRYYIDGREVTEEEFRTPPGLPRRTGG